MASFDIGSPTAKSLIGRLTGLTSGGSAVFPSMFPGLPGNSSIAKCVGYSKNCWTLELEALGVQFATVVVSIEKNTVIIAEL